MTLYSDRSSMFPYNTKNIQFGNKNISVISGSTTLAGLSLCDVSIEYENYQKISMKVPPGAEDFVLSFPTLGTKPTFLSLTAKYCATDPDKHFMYWQFLNENGPEQVMTNVMVLTGTTTNPIPTMILTNPSDKCAITLDILIASSNTDYLSDLSNYIHLTGLVYNDIFSYQHPTPSNPTAPHIIGINQDSNLALTIDVSNIINFIKVPNMNRIIIDDNTAHDIILDFNTSDDAFQVLSELSYLINNPSTTILPMPKDTVAPVITYTPPNTTNLALPYIDYIAAVPPNTKDTIKIGDTSNPYGIDLTKPDIINLIIASVTDTRDGTIVMGGKDVTLTDSQGNNIAMCIATGIYDLKFTINDIAQNETEEEFILDFTK